MKTKKNLKVVVAFIALFCIMLFGTYMVRNFSFASTSPERSLEIFTQIAMQDNFTDAALIGMANPQTVSAWRKDYQTINTAYFSSEFKGFLTPQETNALIEAEKSMNRRRKIAVSVEKMTGNTAMLKVFISKVHYSELVAAAIKKTKAEKEAEKLDTPRKFSQKLAENLAEAFKTAPISDEMTSFTIECKKETISNAPKDAQINVSKFDGFFLFLMEHIAGHCWYPKDANSYFYKLDQAIEQ